jgi:transposase
VFLFDFAASNCGFGLSNQVLAKVFGITPRHVSKVRSKARKLQKPPHQPLKLSEEQEASVLQFVHNGFLSGNSVIQREILNFVKEHFRQTVTYGCLGSFLERWEAEIGWTVIRPQEQFRLQIPREYLNHHISLIKTYVR